MAWSWQPLSSQQSSFWTSKSGTRWAECPYYTPPHSAATLTLSALADRISCACSKSQSGEEWEIRPSSRRSATGRRASLRPQQHRDARSRTEWTGFLLMASVGVLPQADWLPDQRTSLRVRGPCLSAAGERESSRESQRRGPTRLTRSGQGAAGGLPQGERPQGAASRLPDRGGRLGGRLIERLGL